MEGCVARLHRSHLEMTYSEEVRVTVTWHALARHLRMVHALSSNVLTWLLGVGAVARHLRRDPDVMVQPESDPLLRRWMLFVSVFGLGGSVATSTFQRSRLSMIVLSVIRLGDSVAASVLLQSKLSKNNLCERAAHLGSLRSDMVQLGLDMPVIVALRWGVVQPGLGSLAGVVVR